MKFLTSIQKKISSSLIAGLLVCTFILAPVSSGLTVQKVEAADANTAFQALQLIEDAYTALSTALSAVSDAVSSSMLSSLNFKEYVLDTLAWQLTNLVIEQMIRSMTQWINSGFQGSPAFVTDLEGFLTDIADRVAGEFIWGSDLQALCSPFKLDIQIALDIQYQKTRSGTNFISECRLSDVVGNMENFVGGDFLEGGWDGWYALTLTPENNPYGALLEAQSEMSATISNARAQETKLLEFGRGFLSFKDADGSIVTPGVVIEDQLNKTLGIPAGRLTIADELNEAVGALLGQLVGTIFGGGGGLRGLTDSSYGGGNYFGGTTQEANIPATSVVGDDVFAGAIANEQKYLGFQRQIVASISDANTYRTRVYGNTRQCGAGTLSASLQNQLSTAQTSITTANTTITALNAFLNDFRLLSNPQTPNATLQSLYSKYGASNAPAAKVNLTSRFTTYQNSGALHTIADNVNLELRTVPAVRTEVSAFTASIDTACRQNGNGFGGIGGTGILGF